jgi:Tol biopolymer transport system component
MTTNDTFERRLTAWLDETSAHRVPDHLDEVLVRTVATRQRAWWSSPERWLPVDTTVPGRSANLRPVFVLLLIGALILALAGVVLVAGNLVSTTTPYGLADNGRIYVAQAGSIQSLAPDGTDARLEVSVPGGVGVMVTSPDRSKLAYVAFGPADGLSDRIEVRDLASGQTVSVRMPAGVNPGDQISWSPDSRRFVFPAFDRVRDHLYLGYTDGSTAIELGADTVLSAGEVFSPAWSPDGEWIAVGSRDKETGVGTIYLLRPDGTGFREAITPVDLGDGGGISWAPDPAIARLLYVTSSRVFVADIATVDDVTTATATVISDGFWPTWSPDGKKVAWYWGSGLVVADMAAVPLEIGDMTRLFTGGPGGNCPDHPEMAGRSICAPPGWSPDGTRVIGPDTIGSSIVSLPIDGSGDAIVIPTEEGAHEPTAAWLPLRP